mgnify:CR=1 FL=1
MIRHVDELSAADASFFVAPVGHPQAGERVARTWGIVRAIQKRPGDFVFQCVSAAVGILAESAGPTRWIFFLTMEIEAVGELKLRFAG